MTLKEAVDFTKPKKSEKMNSTKSPRTNRDVLLERWAKDTREMAKQTIETKDGGWTFMYHMAGRVAMGETDDYEKAIQREIAYLNSAAEGATK